MAESPSANQRPIWPFIVGVAVIAVAVVGFFVVRDLVAFGRPVPEFPSLADAPDPSLHGTVAYFAVDAEPKTQPTGGCVRAVAAAGAPSKDVLCITEESYDTGPQLVFLPDGRLQVTMFSWEEDQPLAVAWQKIVDVRTGETEDIVVAALPAVPVALGPTVTPTGERITATSRGNTAEMVLTDSAGVSRTLWSADVSPDYGIKAIWAPNWEWVLAHDGRLLVVTVADPAQIRVLVAETEGLGDFGSTEPPLAFFAVTDADLLGAEG